MQGSSWTISLAYPDTDGEDEQPFDCKKPSTVPLQRTSSAASLSSFAFSPSPSPPQGIDNSPRNETTSSQFQMKFVCPRSKSTLTVAAFLTLLQQNAPSPFHSKVSASHQHTPTNFTKSPCRGVSRNAYSLLVASASTA